VHIRRYQSIRSFHTEYGIYPGTFMTVKLRDNDTMTDDVT